MLHIGHRPRGQHDRTAVKIKEATLGQSDESTANSRPQSTQRDTW